MIPESRRWRLASSPDGPHRSAPPRLLLAGLFVFLWASPSSAAGGQSTERTGQELYRAACAACHGIDGRGAPASHVGFDTPLPDFSNCSFATREADADWFAVAHDGGPVRSFDRRMPAFGDALVDEEIERAVSHIRTFCAERGWPRGELNLPRALVTEKAYPEDEAVLTLSARRGAEAALVQTLLYERRLGARGQVELQVPLAAARSPDGWGRGLGDIAVAFKRVLADHAGRGSIVSAGGEVVFPTGKETQGLGDGVLIVEPFLAYGQVLPRNAFLHAQAGLELPTDRARAPAEAFWRAAAGFTVQQHRFGRSWSPIVELLGVREAVSGERVHWDAVPQLQVSLSHRQHVLLNAGVRVPLTQRTERGASFMAYLLWDWFDGGLTDGWR